MTPVLSPGSAWLITAALAGWMALVCLRVIGAELDSAERRLHLRRKVARLRAEQKKRLRELAAVEAARRSARTSRTARSASGEIATLGEVDVLEPADVARAAA